MGWSLRGAWDRLTSNLGKATVNLAYVVSNRSRLYTAVTNPSKGMKMLTDNTVYDMVRTDFLNTANAVGIKKENIDDATREIVNLNPAVANTVIHELKHSQEKIGKAGLYVGAYASLAYGNPAPLAALKTAESYNNAVQKTLDDISTKPIDELKPQDLIQGYLKGKEYYDDYQKTGNLPNYDAPDLQYSDNAQQLNWQNFASFDPTGYFKDVQDRVVDAYKNPPPPPEAPKATPPPAAGFGGFGGFGGAPQGAFGGFGGAPQGVFGGGGFNAQPNGFGGFGGFGAPQAAAGGASNIFTQSSTPVFGFA